MGARRVRCMVIGSGPGGYPAGIRLGQLGVETVVVERDRPGGVCLNVGCIPSKALIHVAEQVDWLRNEAAKQGVEIEGFSINGEQLQAWKSNIVQKLTSGVTHLLKGNEVEYVQGTATLISPREVNVVTDEGPTRFEPESIILATGCHAIQVPGFSYTHDQVLSYREALDLEEIPGELLVIGGGVIGLEMGMVWAQLGSKVTVVEMTDSLLPGTDPDLVRPLTRSLKQRGVTIHTSSKAMGFEDAGNGKLSVQVQTPKKTVDISADKVLVAVGMRPNSEGLGLDSAGVRADSRGFIPVDGQCRTNVNHILAVGDVTGPPLLAHRASKMGEIAAEVVAGHSVSMDDVRAMPAATYTNPEIATVGLSEADARGAGHDVIIGKFNFMANGRALCVGKPTGLVKVVAEAGTERILGVGLVGPGASELIAECALALEFDACLEDLALVVHTHPTLSEAVMEATKAARGEAIHALN